MELNCFTYNNKFMKNIANNLNFIFMAKNIEKITFEENKFLYFICQSVIWIFNLVLLFNLFSYWK